MTVDPHRLRKIKGYDEDEILNFSEIPFHDIPKIMWHLIEALDLRVVRPRHGREREVELVRMPK